MVDAHGIGHVDRVVEVHHLAVGEVDLVDDRRRGREQVEVELALQPLLDDLEMQQAEEAAAEAEAERCGAFRLVDEAGVVEMQLGQALAQFLELGGVDREQAAEHDRQARLEAGERLGGQALLLGDRVADPAIGDALDGRRDEADLARPERRDVLGLGREHADALDLVGGAGRHHADLEALASRRPSLMRTSTTTPR